jgi:restriction endonuclease S subunit
MPINSFLKEREDRFKPEEANKKGLKRIEKIDFSGNIHLIVGKDTHTGMILVKKGDLLISGINVEKGAIAVYTEGEDAFATIHYSSYKFDKTKIDVDYFKWFLKSQKFKDIVNANIRSGIKTELKPKKFLPLIIPLPDLDNQIRIRKKIDSVEKEITEVKLINYKNEDYVKKLRQTILQEAVSGKLVPQDPNDEPASELLKKIKAKKEKLIREKKIRHEKVLSLITEEEIPYELPKGWIKVRLNVLGTFCGGGTPSMHKSEYWNGNIPWLSPKDFIGSYLNTSELKITPAGIENSPAKLIPPNSILIVARSGILKRKLPVSINTVECTVNQDIKVLKPHLPEMSEYIRYLLLGLESIILTDLIKTGTTVQSLKYEKFENFFVPLPPQAEQKRIVEKIDQLMKLCDELDEKVKESQKNTKLLMDAVLREAFEN